MTSPLLRAITALFAMLAVASCATRPTPADGSACCVGAERQPPWLIALLEPVAPLTGIAVSRVVWRSGHLARHEGAIDAVVTKLRPLDIVLVSSRGRLSNHTIPGYFAHAAIHVGNEADLRRADLWDAVSEVHRKSIRAEGSFIEADQSGVHLSRPQRALAVDRVLVLRPKLTHARPRAVLATYLDALGMPFDFNFDLDTPDCVFCTELVNRAMPELGLPVQRVYGRRLILADAIAQAAITGRIALEPVLYVTATREGWQTQSPRAVLRSLEEEWGGRGTRLAMDQGRRIDATTHSHR